MVTGGHMKRIKAEQIRRASSAKKTRQLSIKDVKNPEKFEAEFQASGKKHSAWNTSSMADDEVGTRNPKLKAALQASYKRPKKLSKDAENTGDTTTGGTTTGGTTAGDTVKKKRKRPQTLESTGKTGKRRARAKARERAIKKNKTSKGKKKGEIKTRQLSIEDVKDPEAFEKEFQASGEKKSTNRRKKGK